MRRRGFASLAWASAQDLFDQTTAFGRLALVHVLMMAGDTLVTVSLAGSLFFSVSPTEAKGKVLAYLLLTIAPFAVVSPLLGPLIDKSANGRRILVALSAGFRVVLCWSMSQHLNSLWLFPLAFLVLISSKLYVVTRGALVPEMARTDQFREHAAKVGEAGWPAHEAEEKKGFAGFNAQLTLLGTLVGLIAGSIGAGLLKGIGAPSVLIAASIVFVAATVASVRLQRPAKVVREEVTSLSQTERDMHALNPTGDIEVSWGLTASALMRFTVGFATFLLAFGLRREHAGLTWFAFALAVSAVGALIGLGIVTRVRVDAADVVTARDRTRRGSRVLLPVPGGPGHPRRVAGRLRRGDPAEFRRHYPAPCSTRRAGSDVRPLRRSPATPVGHWGSDPGGHCSGIFHRRRAARHSHADVGSRVRNGAAFRPSMNRIESLRTML